MKKVPVKISSNRSFGFLFFIVFFIRIYKNNLFHGTGTITYFDGSKYIGNWEKGTYHGKGIYTFPNGKKEKGRFVKGKFTG